MKKTHPVQPIRLVALDLDGTTLDPNHQLHPATISEIRRVVSQGIRVVLASGRLYHSIIPFAQSLGLPEEHIGLNGGVTFSASGTVGQKHTLTPEQVHFAHELVRRRGYFPMVFGIEGLWASKQIPEVEFLHNGGEPAARFYDIDRVDSIPDPAKVITVLPPGCLDESFASEAGSIVHVVRSGPRFLEFMPPGVSKGAALAGLLERWKIPFESVMAIGDSENDASMLSRAGFSVAMGNGVPAIRALADVTTATNGDNGVAVALRQWIPVNSGQ